MTKNRTRNLHLSVRGVASLSAAGGERLRYRLRHRARAGDRSSAWGIAVTPAPGSEGVRVALWRDLLEERMERGEDEDRLAVRV